MCRMIFRRDGAAADEAVGVAQGRSAETARGDAGEIGAVFGLDDRAGGRELREDIDRIAHSGIARIAGIERLDGCGDEAIAHGGGVVADIHGASELSAGVVAVGGIGEVYALGIRRGASLNGFVDFAVAVVVDLVAGDFIEAGADEFRIGNCRALSLDVAAVAAADRDAVAVEIFHAVDFAVAVEVIFGLVGDILSADEIGDRHDHADAVAPFVASAGLCAGLAGADAGGTGRAIIAGTRFAVGAVAFCGCFFAAVGHVFVAVDIVCLAGRALSFDAGDV